MPDPDLILLHPPSVYDFRQRPSMHGPISDVIPSTPIFEMYPLGFVSIMGYMEKHGYHTRIINLAVKMLKNPKLDVEELLAGLRAQAFGLDLHWLVHAAGSLDVAAALKRHHPDTPVILGGLSASYFHEEIAGRYPQVDYVLRGDTTEKPLVRLMEHIERGEEPHDVENLTWRTTDGRKKVNPLTFVPENLDDAWVDYGEVVKMVVKHLDLESALPYENFMEYPFTALLTCKGCSYNCITCGGSCYAFRKHFNRGGPAFKTPERLVEEMRTVTEYFKAPLFLIGDLRQAGMGWAEEVLERIRREDIDNTITYELFDAVPRDYMRKLKGSTESWTLEISPETHDDALRGIMGKPYTTQQMEDSIENALESGCKKVDVFFMVGLSGQTSESVLESVEYCRHLYGSFKDRRIFTFITPMAPFMDPGSIIYDSPERYGYTRLYNTLAEHKQALDNPSWKLYLSYYTKWMNRDQIAETTYEAMIRMNQLKAEAGVVNRLRAEQVSEGLAMARDITRRLDEIIASAKSEDERQTRYRQLKQEIDDASRSTVLSKRELRMPGGAGLRVRGAVTYLARMLRGKL
ncbi:MAG TPA: TIGR04190 family B12-binding domain/radical SAM domain protein [Candidatus Bathyarchaeia archaeon]